MIADVPGPWFHPTADVEPGAHVGSGSRIWDLAKVRSGARIGAECTIGRLAYVDDQVTIGDRCKVQNNALLYGPATLGDGVFVGPAVVLTNDRHPRAVSPDGSLVRADHWTRLGVTVGDGAALGAGSVVVSGMSIGAWALVAAGAVVASDVAAHELVAGVPAARIGWVSQRGHRLVETGDIWTCPVSGAEYDMIDGVMRQR